MVDAGRGMGDPFSDSLDISADVGNDQASHDTGISIFLILVSTSCATPSSASSCRCI